MRPCPQEDYRRRLPAERARKDEIFRTGGKDSPVKAEESDKFLPLTYFADRPAYAAPAQLQLQDRARC